jgi:hypothetical protein
VSAPLLTLHEAVETDSGEQSVSLSVVVGGYEYRLVISTGTFQVAGPERDWKPLHDVSLDRIRDGVTANLLLDREALG